jgi:hypothetical protein
MILSFSQFMLALYSLVVWSLHLFERLLEAQALKVLQDEHKFPSILGTWAGCVILGHCSCRLFTEETNLIGYFSS